MATHIDTASKVYQITALCGKPQSRDDDYIYCDESDLGSVEFLDQITCSRCGLIVRAVKSGHVLDYAKARAR